MYHIFASCVACFGMLASIIAMIGEKYKWASFGEFSIATKVPVELFFVTGPIVLVTTLLYGMFAFLLATERATSTVFYFSASWSVIFTDMSLILYKDWRTLVHRRIDMCLHAVNIITAGYSFANMAYMPTSFLLIVSGCWGCLVMSRVVKRYFEKHRPRLPSRELERARERERLARSR